MKTRLDTAVRSGGVTVAAIARHSLHCDCRRAVSAFGEKRPVAILLRRDGVTLAFGIDGAPIALDDLERRFPDIRAEFERIVTASPGAEP